MESEESVGSKRRIQSRINSRGRRLDPFVLEGVGGRNSLPSAQNSSQHYFLYLKRRFPHAHRQRPRHSKIHPRPDYAN